ncbi:MAG: glutamate 5-kinase [Candidatus Hydrogenedentota bacterium]
MNTNLTEVKTVVVKIGTSLLSGERGFDGQVVEGIVKELSTLKRERALNILMVSSGAMGCGMDILGMKERPKLLPLKQATAAVGQSRLMHYYETLFLVYGNGLKTAQILLSPPDLDNRRTYLNIRNTIRTLFDFGSVIPIVNENDPVSTDELKFGDNDTLAARIASKIDADLLILLSNIDGLYDCDPSQHPGAKLIEQVDVVTPDLEQLADDTFTETTIGGMKTKLEAAKIACASGLPMAIANGQKPHIIQRVLDGEEKCTMFGHSHATLPQRKRWIAFGRASRGAIEVDEGCRRALIKDGSSLLPAGITGVSDQFEMGAAVRVLDPQGREIGCGLVNYSSDEIERIMGCKTKDIQAILGRKDFDEIIHRDNLVLLSQ